MMETNPAYSSNPFGAPAAAAPSQMNGANPFGAAAAAAPSQDPWMANPPAAAAPVDSGSIASGYPSYPNTSTHSQSDASNQNPFGAPPPAQQHQQPSPYGYPPVQQQQQPPPAAANPYGAPTQPPALLGTNPYGINQTNGFGNSSQHDQNPYGAAPPPQQQQMQPPPPVPFEQPPPPSNPFGAPMDPKQNNALVVAPAQSNPYAMAPPPQQQPGYDYSQQQLATVPQQANTWAMPGVVAAPQYGAQPAPSYDPFMTTPALAPPAPMAGQVASANQEMDLFFQSTVAPSAAPPTQMEPPPHSEMISHDPPGIPANGQPQDPPPRSEKIDEKKMATPERPTGSAALPDSTASPKGTTYPPQIGYGQRPDMENDHDPSSEMSPRNPYAPTLAREAPPGASPLPKAELVKKRGFVLGRISFRTIVMKKWKQTYWVQYGPHTMLWFRSQADFDDWLNNPYHMQTERNFLIKLAVNFVHDLYKPNVRGYQVTQCRTKGYGNKIVRQFKLERWMDYGPTIAAAFGSYNPAEVDALREAVVECMRNTPLNGGIRATGAVRQQPNPESHSQDRGSYDEDDADGYREHEGDGRRSSYDELPPDKDKELERHDKSESVAEEADLLDVNNWDDVPTEPQGLPPSQGHGGPPNPYGSSGAPVAPYGAAAVAPPDQQHLYHQQQQQQPYGYQQQQQQYGAPPQPQANYSTALVPAAGQPQAYPGAPPPQQWAQPQQQGYPPQQSYPIQQQPQAYRGQPPNQHTDPWSAPPPAAQPQPTYLAPPEY